MGKDEAHHAAPGSLLRDMADPPGGLGARDLATQYPGLNSLLDRPTIRVRP
jgi:hypothetical protein